MRWPDRMGWAERRVRNISFIIAAAFILLIGGLWNVQIINVAKYVRLARNFRVRRVYLPARRGNIYDRNGRLIAGNRVSWDVEVVAEDVDDVAALSGKLGLLLGLDPSAVAAKIRRAGNLPFMPITIARDIGLERATMLEERRLELAGVTVSVYPRRRYVRGEVFAHIVGYTGAVDIRRMNERAEYDYIAREVEGKAGAEKAFESSLRGVAGGEQIQVDSRGYRDSVLGSVDPVPGSNLYLTVDAALQEALWSALGDKSGCAIAMDPGCGDILAMVSRPSYDPNVFVSPTSSADVREIFSNPSHPMVNRVVTGTYPPGSIFKIVVALAALRKGSITAETSFHCDGTFCLGMARFRCWRKGGHGTVRLVDAIRGSCNVYFYNVGIKTGRKSIVEEASCLGLGEATGVNLPGEAGGFIPAEGWVENSLGEGWFPGDTASFSIGQGYLTVTPIQLAVAVSATANGGTVFKPRIVKHVISPDGGIIQSFQAEEKKKCDIDPHHLKLVREGMIEVVNSPRGSGRRAKVEGFNVAGKTGTIQVAVGGKKTNHGLFACFAPAEEPEIVVVVLVENAVSGGHEAAPVARAFLEEYLLREKKTKDQIPKTED